MMKVALLLLCSIVLVSAFTETEYQDAFSTWMHKFQRVYTSDEFQARYTIFKANMDYVQEWNSQNTETILGLNNMADLSNAEYKQIYLGTKIDGTARLAAAAGKKVAVADNYNATVDWRTKGVVTPIKNQGQCGSCWSFSTTGSTEGAHALATNNLVSLSEQNLMDCSGKYGNQGCNGGLMDQAFQYIIANGGIDTEASYPYQAVQGTCKYNAANSGATLAAYADVTSGSETDLATFAQKQPVSVAIDAGRPSFQLYAGGIYHDIFCSSTALDHGVLVVGYGVDTTSSKNYWIVKNSWGPTWGLQGYIYMSKDRQNNCGIATAASVPYVTKPSVEVGATTSTTKHTTHVSTATHHTASSGPSSSGPSSHGPSSSGPSSSNTQSSYGGGVPSYSQGGRGAVNPAKFNF